MDKPENYELRFNANGELGVKADCNGGGATYKTNADKLTISSNIGTQLYCGDESLDSRFKNGLQTAKTFRIKGNFLTIDADGENLKFFKVSKQN